MPATRLTNVADWDTMLGYIRTALNSAGSWTFNQDLQPPDVAGAANGRILVATNSDCLVGLRSTQSGLGANRLYLFDGIPPYGTPAFSTLDNLPGNSGLRVSAAQYVAAADVGRVINPAFAGPFPSAFIFTNNPSTYCHVCVEVSAGRYRHVAFGNLAKSGTWTGGGYYASTFWDQTPGPSHVIDDPGSASHSVLFDSAPVTQPGFTLHYENLGFHWVAPVQTTLNGADRRRCYGSVRGGFGQAFRNVAQTSFSGLTAVVPITLWPYTSTDSPPTTRSCGQVPDLFEINLRNFAPGASYYIGATEYVVFPLSQKGVTTDRLNAENSGNYGLAYKVIP